MCNNTPVPEVIRGHTGTLSFENGNSFRVTPQKLDSKPAPPGQKQGEAGPLVKTAFKGDNDLDTRALWDHYIECLRSRNVETLCPAETGYAAIATVNLGVDSYRYGKAYYFDKATGKVSDADESWAKKWEKVSHDRGKPEQVMGWKADPLDGSVLVPPGYQKLEGDWVNGQGPRQESLIHQGSRGSEISFGKSRFPKACETWVHEKNRRPPRNGTAVGFPMRSEPV